jgi:peptide-methionine (S)-S-oxide reductase
MKGVSSAISGYQGGKTVNPRYEEICEGDTDHAEVVAVTFNPAVLPLNKLLSIFFHVHDPTTPNRQGNDVGTQYRSAVFFTSEAQKKEVEDFIRTTVEPKWGTAVVTQIAPASAHPFYPAEDYHQNYFEKNPGQGYCRAVVAGKVRKAFEKFPEQVK